MAKFSLLRRLVAPRKQREKKKLLSKSGPSSDAFQENDDDSSLSDKGAENTDNVISKRKFDARKLFRRKVTVAELDTSGYESDAASTGSMRSTSSAFLRYQSRAKWRQLLTGKTVVEKRGDAELPFAEEPSSSWPIFDRIYKRQNQLKKGEEGNEEESIDGDSDNSGDDGPTPPTFDSSSSFAEVDRLQMKNSAGAVATAAAAPFAGSSLSDVSTGECRPILDFLPDGDQKPAATCGTTAPLSDPYILGSTEAVSAIDSPDGDLNTAAHAETSPMGDADHEISGSSESNNCADEMVTDVAESPTGGEQHQIPAQDFPNRDRKPAARAETSPVEDGDKEQNESSEANSSNNNIVPDVAYLPVGGEQHEISTKSDMVDGPSKKSTEKENALSHSSSGETPPAGLSVGERSPVLLENSSAKEISASCRSLDDKLPVEAAAESKEGLKQQPEFSSDLFEELGVARASSTLLLGQDVTYERNGVVGTAVRTTTDDVSLENEAKLPEPLGNYTEASDSADPCVSVAADAKSKTHKVKPPGLPAPLANKIPGEHMKDMTALNQELAASVAPPSSLSQSKITATSPASASCSTEVEATNKTSTTPQTVTHPTKHSHRTVSPKKIVEINAEGDTPVAAQETSSSIKPSPVTSYHLAQSLDGFSSSSSTPDPNPLGDTTHIAQKLPLHAQSTETPQPLLPILIDSSSKENIPVSANVPRPPRLPSRKEAPFTNKPMAIMDRDILTPISILRTICYSLRSAIGDGSVRQKNSHSLMERRALRPNGSHVDISHWSHRGRRAYMEDRYVIERMGSKDFIPITWLSVFDGHGGALASQFISDWLSSYVRKHENYPRDLSMAMKSAFMKIDTDFVSTGYFDGSTACACSVIGSNKVICCNAGDSRAIIVKKDGSFVALSEDHKPGRADETKRINDAGGRVIHWGRWRVQGVLAVSRSIGDAKLKPFVIAEPDIVEHDIGEDDLFLVIASDGVWDTMTSDLVAKFVLINTCKIIEKKLHIDKMLLRWIARQISKRARDRGSSDNISCIVANLQIKPDN